jgi:hypothetical protein
MTTYEQKNIDNLRLNNNGNDNNNNININEQKIYLIAQYFIHPNIERSNEIISCLRRNLQLNQITKIYLLNEKIYNDEELGIDDLSIETKEKIEQISINKRMTYTDALLFIKLMHEKGNIGYYIIANSDIFFDDSLKNLQITSLSIEKSFYALLRYEYDEKYGDDLSQSKLFGPFKTSQDTWIIHSNFCPSNVQIEKCNFSLGIQGCDNVILYLFFSFGYKVYNEPYVIRTYHLHSSQIRNYSEASRLPRPYLFAYPVLRRSNLVRIFHEAT